MTKITYRMMRLMARMMPSCRDVSALVSQGMDGRVSWRRRLTIRMHLSMCSLCRRYERQLRLLREAADSYGDPERNQLEPGLSEPAKQRLRESLKPNRH